MTQSFARRDGRVLFVAASPSATSKSTFAAGVLAAELRAKGAETQHFSLRDFDAADVLLAQMTGPRIADFVDAAKQASAIVLSTPVYKASYSGALKALVDLIPPDALAGKPALGVATARVAAHSDDVHRAFEALFRFFQGRPLETLFVLDSEVSLGTPGGLGAPAEARARDAARQLQSALDAPVAMPRPRC
jgi:FMN reductase